MHLNFGITFQDFSNNQGLAKLDTIFWNYVPFEKPNALLQDKEYSEFLLKIAPYFDDFIADLFCIKNEVDELRKSHEKFSVVYECKRRFVQRIAIKEYPKDKLEIIEFEYVSKVLKEIVGDSNIQYNLAECILKWLLEPDKFKLELDIAAQYCAYMVHMNSKLPLFSLPQKGNYGHLYKGELQGAYRNLNLVHEDLSICKTQAPATKELEYRIGFDYYDPELSEELALDDVHYCIYCHYQNKDYCSRGSSKHQGCPLEQKISEMNYVKSKGFVIAALAIIVIDNPIVAATGHRICSDCMDACIYTPKQDPVNIPRTESSILNEILSLPYGVEIYLLLTRWNPLNLLQPVPKNQTSGKVLITGLGPSGFSLAYYLLRDGHTVVGIDGNKIAKIPFDVTLPIESWNTLSQKLSTRNPQGFGGVAEYGITNRWNKNNLLIIRIMLNRYKNYKEYGSVRLGSNITIEQAFNLGFEHIAMCIGAAPPKFLLGKNFFANGVMAASDFLMTLQLGGAYLPNSNTDLIIRLPAIVIGCGLTAIDAAVEILNYYPVMVQKFLHCNSDNEFTKHAKLFQNMTPIEIRKFLIEELGGVTICYRKELEESHSYKLNYREINFALSVGVKFIENTVPVDLHTDSQHAVTAVQLSNGEIISARTVLIAIGTEKEHKMNDIITYESLNWRNSITYFGDCNPEYSGSVVKALANSKLHYKTVGEKLQGSRENCLEFFSKLDDLLISKIHDIQILSANQILLSINSKLVSHNFKLGQFVKLQSYSSDMKPLALSIAKVQQDLGLISLVVENVGNSSGLCWQLRKNEEVALMGPVGIDLKIDMENFDMLIGFGVANSALIPIAETLQRIGKNFTHIVLDDASSEGFHIAFNKVVKDIHLNRILCALPVDLMEYLTNNKESIFGLDATLICFVYSQMQCMMQGICGKCVQPNNKGDDYVFSCSCQIQQSEVVNFATLKARLK